MKITCESCGAKYTIADDKVIGRKVKIRCKGCSTPIVVDGQKLGPSGAPPAGADTKAETLVPSPSTLVPTPAEWSVNFSETDQRTLTTQQILEGYQAGQIPSDVYVWRDGMADWVPLLECAELAPLLTGAPAPAAPPVEAPPPPGYGAEAAAAPPAAFPAAATEAAPAEAAPAAGSAPEEAPPPSSAPQDAAPPPSARPGARAVTPASARETPPTATPQPAAASRTSAARVSGGRSAGAHDLFAGVETAGAENLDIPVTAPALPQAGSTAYDDRPTGARNENSVLFSLDSLKAGNLAPTPKASGGTPDDPFGMGSPGSVAGIGGGNALFTLADNQRLLSAPPPPPEPPPRTVAEASAAPSLPPVAMTRKTLGIVIGGVVAVLLLGVGIGVALSGGDDQEKGEAASATAAASAAPDERKPEEKEEKSATKEEEPAPPPAESATAKAEEKPAEEEAKGGTASTAPAAAKPGTAKPAAPKKETAAPAPVADQPFNRGAAVSAMSAAANQAASCKKPGGPTGSGKATLTFAPTGRVTSATVTTPPFAGTAVGGCVASVFRRAKVPPFTGNPITVSKSFTIR